MSEPGETARQTRYGETWAPLTDAPPEGRNLLGLAGLLVGVAAVLTSVTVAGGVVLGVVAVLLAVAGRRRVRAGEATNPRVATAGLVVGIVGIAFGVAAGIGLTWLFTSPNVQQYLHCATAAGDDRAQLTQCGHTYLDR